MTMSSLFAYFRIRSGEICHDVRQKGGTVRMKLAGILSVNWAMWFFAVARSSTMRLRATSASILSFITHCTSMHHPYVFYLLNTGLNVPMITSQLRKEHGVLYILTKLYYTGPNNYGSEQYLSTERLIHPSSTHYVEQPMQDAQWQPWNTCQEYLK